MGKTKMTRRTRAILGISTAFIVIAASFSAVLFWPEKAESEYQVNFSEFQLWGEDPDEEWIELYQWDETIVNLDGWTLQVAGEKKWSLPAIELHEFEYVNIHMGGKAAWEELYPQTNGRNLFLNLEKEGLPDPGAELILRDSKKLIVDTLVYGNGRASLTDYWDGGKGNILGSNLSRSFSIWGEDLDSAENWYDSEPTPNNPNVYSFTAYDEVTVIEVYNGYSFGTINFEDDLSIHLTGRPIEVKCHPSSNKYKKDIEEYAKYSLKFFNDSGYGEAHLGPDGKIDIHVGKGKTNETCGACWSNGTVIIDLGKKNPDSFAANVSRKYCVEHELFHAVQNRIKDGNQKSMGSNFFTEGMATLMGIYSVMGNFNLTMEQAMYHLFMVNDHNWWEHGVGLNTSVFYYWGGNYNDYMQAFFLFKYLAEMYGNNTLLEIHKRTRRYLNGTVIKSPQQAIEEVVGKSFEDIMREYYVWRILNAEIANGLPNAEPNFTALTQGYPLSDELRVMPGGAVLEEFIVYSPHDLMFNFTVTHRMKMTFLIYYKNGTIGTFHYDVHPPPADNSVSVDVLGVDKVQILKQNLDSVYIRKINTTCNPIYVTTPNGAYNNATSLQYHDGSPTDTNANHGSLPHFRDETRENDTSYWFTSGKEWLVGHSYQIRLYQNHHFFPEMSAPLAGSITEFGFEVYNSFGLRVFVGITEDIFADPLTMVPMNTYDVLEEDTYYIKVRPNGFMGCFELVVDDLN